MSDKRSDGESFEDYKKRLKEQATHLKHRLKGTWFWHSTEVKEVVDHDKLDENGQPVTELQVVGRTYRKADYEQ